MKRRRVGVDGVAVLLPRALALQIVSQRDESSSDQTRADMASMLSEELIEEILLRVPPDEPAHLVRASLICKDWHSILSDDTFRRRYHRFHRTRTLQGYFYDDFKESKIRFVPTTSMVPSDVCILNFFDSCSRKASVVDCRHGRLLIETYDSSSLQQSGQFIVWDPVTGSQQHLNFPAYPEYPYPYTYYVACVLCAKNNCDHLDCHGGPFLVVFVVSGHMFDRSDGEHVKTWASTYSSETGAWSASMTNNVRTHKCLNMSQPAFLIGDSLYFNTVPRGYSIVKYDLCRHELSVIHLPGEFEAILIKGSNRGLGLATMIHNCFCWSSWKVDNKNGSSGSMEYKVMKVDDLPGYYPTDLICMVEGTNTVLVHVECVGLFALDLKSRQVRQIGEEETRRRRIFPYICFYTPKY